jgi:hypothetical protein
MKTAYADYPARDENGVRREPSIYRAIGAGAPNKDS